MNNKQVAHLWANKSRTSAKGSSFYFEGDTIYSYGSHFPIARHYKGVILFTSKGYSSSTARHKSYVRQAINHLITFTVSEVLRDPCREDVKEYREQLQRMAKNAAMARNPAPHLESLERATAEANLFCETFGFKTRFSMPDNLEELRARALVAQAKEKKAKAAKLAKQAEENEKTIAKWLAGEFVSIPWGVDRVYLRARNKDESLFMETSKGATVPISEAEKAFRFVMLKREKGWHRNGDQFAIGEFHLDAVNAQGVVAGCHRITWEEIERFAKTQGWI